MHLWLYTLFIDHTYMFRSPSATFLTVQSTQEYSNKWCMANQSQSSFPAVNLPTSTTGDFTTYKYKLLITLSWFASRILKFYNILQITILDWFATHNFVLYRMVAEGDRNMSVWSVNNAYNYNVYVGLFITLALKHVMEHTKRKKLKP
jgi:hypothetical protein